MTLAAFVKQIAVRLSEDDVPMPLRNQAIWHALFYKLKKSNLPAKPEFLADLWFDWDGPAPESPELSELIARFQWNASVSATNPSYETIAVRQEVATLWKREAPALSHDEEAFIAQATAQAKASFIGPNT